MDEIRRYAVSKSNKTCTHINIRAYKMCGKQKSDLLQFQVHSYEISLHIHVHVYTSMYMYIHLQVSLHWVTSILHLGLCDIWLFAAKGVVVH